MKAVIALSGGLDSCCLTGHLKQAGYDVIPVSFTYGSKHNQYENEAARMIADFYQTKLIEIDMSTTFQHFESNLLKKGGEIPEGHYEDKNMKLTVVPGRNMIFLSILAGIAQSRGVDTIGIGVHAGDHAIYPDCRPEFIERMEAAVVSATDGLVNKIEAPFINKTKGEIIMHAGTLKIEVPLSLTRTCYKDQPAPCGKCGSCVERLEAFEYCGFADPVIYEAEK